MRIRANVENGNIVTGGIAIPDGEYIIDFTNITPKTVEEWRKYYFALRDALYEDGETGYTKSQLHDLAKKHLLHDLVNDANNFIEEPDPLKWFSTSWLSSDGWQAFVKSFKEWAFDKFNCYL